MNKLCWALALLFFSCVRSLCNSSAPIDAPWIADAWERCGQIPACDHVFGVSRGLTVASFEQFVFQAGALNTSVGLDAWVCDRTDEQAALDMFVVFMTLHPPIEACPPPQEYRPAARSCGYPLDRTPIGTVFAESIGPVLLGAIFAALCANVVVRLIPQKIKSY